MGLKGTWQEKTKTTWYRWPKKGKGWGAEPRAGQRGLFSRGGGAATGGTKPVRRLGKKKPGETAKQKPMW